MKHKHQTPQNPQCKSLSVQKKNRIVRIGEHSFQCKVLDGQRDQKALYLPFLLFATSSDSFSFQRVADIWSLK